MRAHYVAWLVAPLLTAGCGGKNGQDGKDAKLIDSWEGSQPHFEASGTLNGKTFSFAMSPSDAAQIKFLNATRKFCVPDVNNIDTYSQGYIYDLDINVRDRLVNSYVGDVFGAAFDKFELSFEGVGFNVAGLAGELEVVPGTSTTGEGQVKVQISIVDKDQPSTCGPTGSDPCPAENDFFGAYAETGIAAFGAWSGRPEDGDPPPAGEGPIGAVVNARWSQTEEVTISFSAYAEHNKVKDPVAEPDVCKF